MKNEKRASTVLTAVVASAFLVAGCIGATGCQNKNVPVASSSTSAASASATSKPVTSDVSKESQYVLNKAKQYTSLLRFSKDRLYMQLSSLYGEYYSEEAAQYAVDNIGIDWNKSALDQARYYVETKYMSKEDAYAKLTDKYGDMFTEAEAQYAIDNI